jgi:hypothetical protein
VVAAMHVIINLEGIEELVEVIAEGMHVSSWRR